MKQRSAATIFLVSVAWIGPMPYTSSIATFFQQNQVNPDTKVLLDFKARVDRYVEMRKKAAAQVQPLKNTENPAEIKAAEEDLAQRIRALRADAKHGDIFTPEIAAHFKQLLRPEVDKKATKDAIFDANPGNIQYLRVNAVYPEGEPLSTVPAAVLRTLPELTDDIEYRFVDTHMILRDVKANLIIDSIANVLTRE